MARARFQQCSRRTHHLEWPNGIDRVNALEVLRRQSVKIGVFDVLCRTRIIDQTIEPAPRRRSGHDLLAVFVARHVPLDHDHFGTSAPALVGGLFSLFLAG